MSDSKDRNNVVVSCGSGCDGFFIALAIWTTMFYGDPDLMDAIIHDIEGIAKGGPLPKTYREEI